MVRLSDTNLKRSPPLTTDERERALQALERIERRRQSLLDARNGRYFPIAVEVLREIRGEGEESPL